jgi:pimeloyl-ACP methyl ester carboxylesterase
MSVSPELGDRQQVDLSLGPILYSERGRGTPVVFVHGLLVNGDLWRKVVPGLAGEARCITPDWPLGSHEHAMHPDADVTVEGVARTIAEFLEALDLHDVVLVANDTGGAITQRVMTTHPERIAGVVLTSCDCFDNFLPLMFRPLQWLAHVPPLLTGLLQGLRFRFVRGLPFALGWLAKNPIPEPIAASYTGPVLRDAAVRRDTAKLLRSISPTLTLEAAEKLHAFHRPVLIAWAREDRFFPAAHAQALAERLPDAQLELIDDCYTFVSEDNPQALVESILRFLRRQPRD